MQALSHGVGRRQGELLAGLRGSIPAARIVVMRIDGCRRHAMTEAPVGSRHSSRWRSRLRDRAALRRRRDLDGRCTDDVTATTTLRAPVRATCRTRRRSSAAVRGRSDVLLQAGDVGCCDVPATLLLRSAARVWCSATQTIRRASRPGDPGCCMASPGIRGAAPTIAAAIRAAVIRARRSVLPDRRSRAASLPSRSAAGPMSICCVEPESACCLDPAGRVRGSAVAVLRRAELRAASIPARVLHEPASPCFLDPGGACCVDPNSACASIRAGRAASIRSPNFVWTRVPRAASIHWPRASRSAGRLLLAPASTCCALEPWVRLAARRSSPTIRAASSPESVAA